MWDSNFIFKTPMKYLNKSFSVFMGGKKYEENYDKIFRKEDKMARRKSCDHKFKFIESSKVTYKNKEYEIDKYICIKCNKYAFVDKKTKKFISFDNAMGDEVE